jgi:hypothetical protein
MKDRKFYADFKNANLHQRLMLQKKVKNQNTKKLDFAKFLHLKIYFQLKNN